MEHNSGITAPRSIVTDSIVLEALCACGLITEDRGQVTFSHQSYLDFQIASRVVREIYTTTRNVCDWLGNRERQTLFRREQLRQALCLLNEESPDLFFESIKVILSTDGIRFHLKHLCLEILGQLDSPSDALCEYLNEVIHTNEWKEHILGTVYFRHAPYIERLVEGGTIAKWLDSDEWRNYAIWLLRGVADSKSDEVARVLRPYLLRDDEWNDRILATIPWDADADTDDMFAIRIGLARLGVYRDYVNWVKIGPDRSVHLLEAVISSWSKEDLSERPRRGTGRRSRFEDWSDDEAAALASACEG